jgi:adenylylsulfate kinase
MEYKFRTDNLVWSNGKVKYEDRCKILKQNGLVVWFTGISGAGKSTIAIEVERELINLGRLSYRLDGDNIRQGLCSDLGFSESDRNENIRRVAEVAALFRDAGLITLVSLISPYQEMREFAKERIGKDSFLEVYIKADVETCIARDPKGLYKKAAEGAIDNFTGISSIYEEPVNPDIIIDTVKMNVADATKMVVDAILNYCRIS